MNTRARFALSFLFCAGFSLAFGCSSGDAPTIDDGHDAGAPSAASSNGGSNGPSASSDASSSAPSDSGATSSSDGGESCPPASGNAQGIGASCTKGGNQCATYGLSCDIDLDPKGKGICISFLKCTPGHGDCGAGATCCQNQDTQFVAVCLPNACLVDGCTAE